MPTLVFFSFIPDLVFNADNDMLSLSFLWKSFFTQLMAWIVKVLTDLNGYSGMF